MSANRIFVIQLLKSLELLEINQKIEDILQSQKLNNRNKTNTKQYPRNGNFQQISSPMENQLFQFFQ